MPYEIPAPRRDPNRQITVRSADRTSGTSTNFEFNIKIGYAIKSARLDNVIIPNSVYNVTSKNNTVPTSLGNATITSGSYDIGGLITALGTALTAVDAGFSITLSSITMKVTIADANPFKLNFGTGSNSIGTILGFSATDTATGTTFTGTNVYNMLQQPMWYMSVNAFTRNQQTTSGVNYTFSIPVNENTGNFVTYESNADYEQLIDVNDAQPPSTMRCSLVDSTGTVIDLNGLDWQFTVSFA